MKNRFQNICHIYFPDLYLPSTYDKLISNQLKKVIKCFANDGNYYFNLNREFGENLTESELVQMDYLLTKLWKHLKKKSFLIPALVP